MKKLFNRKYCICALAMIVLIFISVFFYETLYYGEYKYPHCKVYTCYEYFTDMQVNGEITKPNYIMYMKSAFVNMVADRKLVVDKRIAEEIMLDQGIEPIQYDVADIGVLELCDEGVHRYSLISGEEVVRQTILYTGEKWEQASVIEIFYDTQGNMIIAPADFFAKDKLNGQEIKPEIFEYEKVNMQMKNDETILRIGSNGEKTEIVFRNLIFVLFIMSVGFLLGRGFFTCVGSAGVWMLFPMGFVNQVITAILMAICHIPINIVTYLVCSYLFAIVINLLMCRNIKVEKKAACIDRFSLVNVGLCGIITVLVSCCPAVILSYDSIFNIYIGKYVDVLGEYNSILDRVSSYSMLTPLIEIGSSLFGIDLNYTLQPIMTVSILAIIGWICFRIIGEGIEKKQCCILIGIVAVAVIVNPMFFIQMYWKLNNLIIGLFMGLVVGFHMMYFKTSERKYFLLANILLVVSTVARVESGLFTAIYLIALFVLFEKKDKGKDVRWISLHNSVILTGMYVYYLWVIGEIDSAFWTPVKGAVVVALCWAVTICLYILLKLRGKWQIVRNNIDKIMFGCIILVMGLLLLMIPDKFTNNVLTFGYNMANYGGYGIVIVAAIISSFILWKKEPIVKFLSIYIMSYVLLILGLLLFRENPIRLGFGDSACRMLTHIVIIAGYLCLIRIKHWINKGQNIGEQKYD